MSATVERVRALVRLAADERTSTEEARTAAVQACRMIVKHGLAIGGGPCVDNPFVRPEAAQAAKAAQAVEDLARDFSEIFDEVEVTGTRRRWKDTGPIPRGRPAPRTKTDTGATMITSKAAGFCAECGDVYGKGERVVWRSESREILHADCYRGRGRRPDLR